MHITDHSFPSALNILRSCQNLRSSCLSGKKPLYWLLINRVRKAGHLLQAPNLQTHLRNQYFGTTCPNEVIHFPHNGPDLCIANKIWLGFLTFLFWTSAIHTIKSLACPPAFPVLQLQDENLFTCCQGDPLVFTLAFQLHIGLLQLEDITFFQGINDAEQSLFYPIFFKFTISLMPLKFPINGTN